MKTLCALCLFVCLFMVAPGCDDSGGGSVVENADQTKLEEYEANQAKLDEEMRAREAAGEQ